MMGIGGVRPAGGGAGEQVPGILIGVAYIQRDVDLVAQRLTANAYLKGCSYKVESGKVGTLDSATGQISLPEGCRIFRQTFHEGTPGLTGLRLIGWIRETDQQSVLGSYGSSGGNGIDGTSMLDTESEAWVKPTFVHMGSSNVVLDADAPQASFIGMVEFFA